MLQEKAGEDGYVTERQMAYFEARARGGVGLILVGSCSPMWPAGSYNPGQTAVSDDKFIPGLAELARRVHAHGGRVALQLSYGGKNGMQDMKAGRPMLLPSLPTESAPDPLMAMITAEETAIMSEVYVAPGAKMEFHEMTREDIAAVVEGFAAATERAKRAGIDGVELHGGHGYLIDSFLSPAQNHRTDEYGGSLENRARFLVEIVRAIRERVGRDYPVWPRLNGTEFFYAGTTIEEAPARC